MPVSSNEGSTVVDLTGLAAAAASGQQQQQQPQPQQDGEGAAAGCFRIVRAGVAADSVVELLTKTFGLTQQE